MYCGVTTKNWCHWHANLCHRHAKAPNMYFVNCHFSIFSEHGLWRTKTANYSDNMLNPLNSELNPIRHLLALGGADHILHVSRVRVNKPINWDGRYLALLIFALRFFRFSTPTVVFDKNCELVWGIVWKVWFCYRVRDIADKYRPQYNPEISCRNFIKNVLVLETKHMNVVYDLPIASNLPHTIDHCGWYDIQCGISDSWDATLSNLQLMCRIQPP